MDDVQLDLRLREPRKIDVDGVTDRQHPDIRYLGVATEQFDGTFRALADVGGCFCLVELKIVTREGA